MLFRCRSLGLVPYHKVSQVYSVPRVPITNFSTQRHSGRSFFPFSRFSVVCSGFVVSYSECRNFRLTFFFRLTSSGIYGLRVCPPSDLSLRRVSFIIFYGGPSDVISEVGYVYPGHSVTLRGTIFCVHVVTGVYVVRSGQVLSRTVFSCGHFLGRGEVFCPTICGASANSRAITSVQSRVMFYQQGVVRF